MSVLAAAFAGTLSTRIQLAPPRDPEFKGMVERSNGYLETSFLPGRRFTSPADFTDQLQSWLTQRANQRRARSIGGRPVDLLETNYESMVPLPPTDPVVGLVHRVRLSRDYYVRIDSNDYSVDPRAIGRFVDIAASPTTITVRCDRDVVSQHQRRWATEQVVRHRDHIELAKHMRHTLAKERERRDHATRHHGDGHRVILRALPDYDALFGVDFDANPTEGALNQ